MSNSPLGLRNTPILPILLILFGCALLYCLYAYFIKKKTKYRTLLINLVLLVGLLGLATYTAWHNAPQDYSFELSDIPPYEEEASSIINKNIPYFLSEDKWEEGIVLNELDSLGRCKEAYGILTKEGLPDSERGSIQDVKPSGWHTIRYDDLIEDHYLYNRCHLIAYELCGINADERNLITGTRAMNLSMVPYENQVSAYIHRTGKPVQYRATPIFEGDHLVASGILLEAKSLEDDEVQFCVFFYNVQPGITINYENGDSWRSE